MNYKGKKLIVADSYELSNQGFGYWEWLAQDDNASYLKLYVCWIVVVSVAIGNLVY